jgi:hypothetical protein
MKICVDLIKRKNKDEEERKSKKIYDKELKINIYRAPVL